MPHSRVTNLYDAQVTSAQAKADVQPSWTCHWQLSADPFRLECSLCAPFVMPLPLPLPQRRLATDFPGPEPNTVAHPPLLNYSQCRSERVPESELPVNGSGLGCLSVREEIMAFDIYYNSMATHFASSRHYINPSRALRSANLCQMAWCYATHCSSLAIRNEAGCTEIAVLWVQH